jgi:hypothetical protein
VICNDCEDSKRRVEVGIAPGKERRVHVPPTLADLENVSKSFVLEASSSLTNKTRRRILSTPGKQIPLSLLFVPSI